jgi:hypothetical protein
VALAKELKAGSVKRWRIRSNAAHIGRREEVLPLLPPAARRSDQVLEDNKISYAGVRVYAINDRILSAPHQDSGSGDDHHRT